MFYHVGKIYYTIYQRENTIFIYVSDTMQKIGLYFYVDI